MSISRSLFKSTGLLFVGRLISRSIGMISTLILARTLTPNDFGIVAIASLVVFFFDAMAQVGIREYLTQKNKLTREDIDTAWTLNLMVKLGFWVVFLVAIPFIASFYGEPSLVNVLAAVSLVLPLLALESVGLVLAQRGLNYAPILKLQVVEKVAGIAVMICLLPIIKNYWVMVVSLVSTFVVRCIGSYVVCPYMPRLHFSKMEEQWRFSRWMLPKGIIGFLRTELDTLIVSKMFGLASLGAFNLIKSFVSMVGRDAIQPATEPLLAVFSKGKSDSKKLKFQVEMGLWGVSLFVLPVVGYCFSFSGLIVQVLYGAQWLEYSDLLKAFSPLIFILATTGVISSLLVSKAKVRQLFWIQLASLSLTAAALVLFPFETLVQFAYVRVLLAIFLWIVLVLYVRLVVPFDLKAVVFLTFPAMVSIVGASYIALFLRDGFLSPYVVIIVCGLTYLVSYLALLFVSLVPFQNTAHVVYLNWFVRRNILKRLV